MKLMKASLAPEDLSTIRYPVLVSPKLDGIRAIRRPDGLFSQRGLLIPNRHVQAWARAHVPIGIDGELILKCWTAPYREVSSAIMSRYGEPDFRLAAFDMVLDGTPFKERIRRVWDVVKNQQSPALLGVPHTMVNSAEELSALHEQHCAEGFEGSMVRDPDGPYKHGKSTPTEGYLWKLKGFHDEEASVYGVEEEMENLNDKDERGKRTSHKDGKFGLGTLGKILCRFVSDGTEFRCGSGFTDAERRIYFDDPLLIVGKLVTIKHQPPPGGRKPGEKPRFPVFKAVRHD